MKTDGVKFDGEKHKWALMPWRELEEVLEVLMFGAKKYTKDNWKRLDQAKERYFEAAQRHLIAWYHGEIPDDESGKHHLAHLICCALFAMWHDKETEEARDELKKGQDS